MFTVTVAEEIIVSIINFRPEVFGNRAVYTGDNQHHPANAYLRKVGITTDVTPDDLIDKEPEKMSYLPLLPGLNLIIFKNFWHIYYKGCSPSQKVDKSKTFGDMGTKIKFLGKNWKKRDI